MVRTPVGPRSPARCAAWSASGALTERLNTHHLRRLGRNRTRPYVPYRRYGAPRRTDARLPFRRDTLPVRSIHGAHGALRRQVRDRRAIATVGDGFQARRSITEGDAMTAIAEFRELWSARDLD